METTNLQKDVVSIFFTLYIQMKTYHFETKIYNRHYNVDVFLENYSKLYDRFIEVSMGHFGPINMGNYTISIANVNDENIHEIVKQFISILQYLKKLYKNHSDLLNIIDEIDAETNQLIYKLRLV
jgi:hypothetical protein